MTAYVLYNHLYAGDWTLGLSSSDSRMRPRMRPILWVDHFRLMLRACGRVDKYQRPISKYKVDLCHSGLCIVTRTTVDTTQDLKELRYLDIMSTRRCVFGNHVGLSQPRAL